MYPANSASRNYIKPILDEPEQTGYGTNFLYNSHLKLNFNYTWNYKVNEMSVYLRDLI